MPRIKGSNQYLTKRICVRVSEEMRDKILEVYPNACAGATTAVRQWAPLRELTLQYLNNLFSAAEMKAIRMVWSGQPLTVDGMAVADMVRRRAGTYSVDDLCSRIESLPPCCVYFLTEWSIIGR